jgi:hypothetical protein
VLSVSYFVAIPNCMLIDLTTTASDPSPTSVQVKMGKKNEELTEKLEKLQRKLRLIRERQTEAEDKINELSERDGTLESRVIAACIKNRNAVSSTALRTDFEDVRKEMGQKKSMNPLQVFCVSALAFSTFLKTNERTKGFSKLADTGIPGLQQWLNRSTLSTRTRNAEAFLGQIGSLTDAMSLWASDISVTYKFLASEKQDIGENFATGLKTLTTVCPVDEIRD